VEYHGVLDDNITNFIHNFFEDFETFINGKFIKKCMRQSLLQLRKIKPNSEKSEKKVKEKLKFQEVNLNKLFLSNKTQEKKVESMKTETPKTPEKPKPTFDNVELFKSEIVTTSTPDSNIKKFNSEIYSPKKNNAKIDKITSKKDPIYRDNQLVNSKKPTDMVEYCNQLIEEINESKIDLSFEHLKKKEKELQIYSKFLEKYRDYKKYFNEKSEWKQESKKENMTIWSRIDNPYMVRKVTISAKLDPELLESTMNNYSLAPKWNPMLGIFLNKKINY
jgi:hypothetical protein